VAQSDHQIRRTMDELLTKAIAEIGDDDRVVIRRRSFSKTHGARWPHDEIQRSHEG
jgi:hypothetical protein